MSNYFEKNPLKGLSTGFDDFDKITSGLQKSDFIIIAGRPSVGKTVFTANIAENVVMNSESPKNVLFFSLCSENKQIIKLMSSLMKKNSLFVDSSVFLSPKDVQQRANKITKSYGDLSLIIIDYLELMQMSRDENITYLSDICCALKGLAKELNIPIVCIAQLNRNLEQRADKRPLISDFKEADVIERYADVITLIYRDDLYNKNSSDKGITEIIIAKQRNEQGGKVHLEFLSECEKFTNYSPDY